MDIGKLKNNTVFYEGFEDEPDIELYLSESPDFNIHIWDGYFLTFLVHLQWTEKGGMVSLVIIIRWNGHTKIRG